MLVLLKALLLKKNFCDILVLFFINLLSNFVLIFFFLLFFLISRSLFKGPFLSPFFFPFPSSSSIFSRHSTIFPCFVGKSFFVYNGFKFVPLLIHLSMVGLKFGSFSPSR